MHALGIEPDHVYLLKGLGSQDCGWVCRGGTDAGGRREGGEGGAADGDGWQRRLQPVWSADEKIIFMELWQVGCGGTSNIITCSGYSETAALYRSLGCWKQQLYNVQRVVVELATL